MDNDLWDNYQNRVGRICEEKGLKVEEVHVGKGETIIWHPLLAHGGAKITDPERTRMSFVIHTTPMNVPVFHTDVFFDVKRPVPDKAPWSYDDVEGRMMAHTTHLTIGHAHTEYDFTRLY
jgi:hypothetical protein